jgi:hypothetical protein
LVEDNPDVASSSALLLDLLGKPFNQAQPEAFLVEDNPDVASSSALLLEELGYRVKHVADAEAALYEVRA